MKIFRKDRNLRGGGVLIGVKYMYNPCELPYDNSDNHELIVVKIAPQLIICCYYRPHISEPSINSIGEILSAIRQQHHDCLLIVAGDMNLPGIDWENNQTKPQTPYKNYHQQFLNIMSENGMTQTITESTHVHGNTLDLLCVSDPSAVLEAQVIAPGLSDHYIITASINAGATAQSPQLAQPKTKEIRLFRDADIERFEQLMGDVHTRLSNMSDVESMWTLFETSFRQAIETTVPTKTVDIQPPDQPPWFTKRTKKLIDKQRGTFRKYKATVDPFFLT